MSATNNSSPVNKIMEGTAGIIVLNHSLPHPDRDRKYKVLSCLFYICAVASTVHIIWDIIKYYQQPQLLTEYEFLITYILYNSLYAIGALVLMYAAEKFKPRIMPEAYILRINDAVPANIILELQRYFMFTPYAGNHPDTWIASSRKTEEITNV